MRQRRARAGRIGYSALGYAPLAEIHAAQGREDDARTHREAAARLSGGR
ncbi:MAG TPA: hypothetical protein VGD06_01225 [Acidobacteriota bacterium]